MRLIDLTGKRFGKLVVIERAKDHVSSSGQHRVAWLCQCDCGNQKIIVGKELRYNNTKSCGCLAKSLSSKRLKTHGLTKHRTYSILTNMHERCCNKEDKRYKDYGGRGIKLCDEWNRDIVGSVNAIKNFYQWSLNNGYREDLSIDRINNDGNYKPSNCRWATQKEQQNNKRNNHILTYNNESLTMPQMARKYKINYEIFRRRIYRGWNIEKALFAPIIPANKKHLGDDFNA